MERREGETIQNDFHAWPSSRLKDMLVTGLGVGKLLSACLSVCTSVFSHVAVLILPPGSRGSLRVTHTPLRLSHR